MSCFEYPHTDFHEMNLDWVIREIRSIREYVDTQLPQRIRETLDKLFIDSMYEPATETLVLILSMEE